MLPPVISIVGKSNSGKTTLIEKLLPELTGRGYIVGTIKHHRHENVEFDIKGKDSWRHKQAGAHQVIVSSPTTLALIRNSEPDLDLSEIRMNYHHGLDLILTEGYKKDTFPKIEVFRKGIHDSMLCEAGDQLIALVTDADIAVDAPIFGLDETVEIVSLLEKRFLLKKKMSSAKPSVKLFINNRETTLSPIIRNALMEIMEKDLRDMYGIEEGDEITVEISTRI